MDNLKLLGVSLSLFKQPYSRGWRSVLKTEELEELLDEIAVDFPTRSDDELAELAQDMLHSEYPELESVKIYYHNHTGMLCGHISVIEEIVADAAAATLTITHPGYTIRSLQGAAAACNDTIRKWNVILMPQNCTLGQILLKKKSQI